MVVDPVLHQAERSGRVFQTSLGLLTPSHGHEVCISCERADGETQAVAQPQAVAVASAFAVLAVFCPSLLNEDLVDDYFSGETLGVSMANGGMAVIARRGG